MVDLERARPDHRRRQPHDHRAGHRPGHTRQHHHAAARGRRRRALPAAGPRRGVQPGGVPGRPARLRDPPRQGVGRRSLHHPAAAGRHLPATVRRPGDPRQSGRRQPAGQPGAPLHRRAAPLSRGARRQCAGRRRGGLPAGGVRGRAAPAGHLVGGHATGSGRRRADPHRPGQSPGNRAGPVPPRPAGSAAVPAGRPHRGGAEDVLRLRGDDDQAAGRQPAAGARPADLAEGAPTGRLASPGRRRADRVGHTRAADRSGRAERAGPAHAQPGQPGVRPVEGTPGRPGGPRGLPRPAAHGPAHPAGGVRQDRLDDRPDPGVAGVGRAAASGRCHRRPAARPAPAAAGLPASDACPRTRRRRQRARLGVGRRLRRHRPVQKGRAVRRLAPPGAAEGSDPRSRRVPAVRSRRLAGARAGGLAGHIPGPPGLAPDARGARAAGADTHPGDPGGGERRRGGRVAGAPGGVPGRDHR